MFLPVLLVRDYGIWGFVVFAVPNVLGAAAMGWVLRAGASSPQLCTSHRAAISAFSFVTIAFHVFWLAWMWALTGTNFIAVFATIMALASVLSLFALRALPSMRSSGLVLWSWAALSASLTSAILLQLDGALAAPSRASATPAQGLGWVAPICLFGFALCPYLDPTFHRARQALRARPARLAFGVGFGFLFLFIILFSLLYAHAVPLARAELSGRTEAGFLLHFCSQTAFTIAAHVSAGVVIARVAGGSLPRAGWVMLKWALMTVPLGLGLFSVHLPHHADLAGGEIVYRVFMSFYGLVFPAYVWLCMIPTRAGESGFGGDVGRRRLLVWAAAVALAAPAFWMGFIERQEWWLGPGLAVVLLARLLIPGGAGFGRLPREPSGAPVPVPTRRPALSAHARPGSGPGDA